MDQIIGMLPLIAAVFVFYFLIVRPNQQKAKNQKEFTQSISKGDLVVTNSGVVGKINKIDEENGIITLQVDTKTFLKVVKDSLSKELSEAIRQTEVEV